MEGLVGYFSCNPFTCFLMNNMVEESFIDPLAMGSQDADYSHAPQLSDELESLILARFPRSEHWKLYLLNKHFSYLLKSGELNKIRKEIGFKEPTVFMSPSGQNCWWTCDGLFECRRKLPELPSLDTCFKNGDKESVCAGSHLIVSGRETLGSVVWRFEHETNRWFKGPSMIDTRCLFASATCGAYAFVAGGIGMDAKVSDSAERYNPETKSWESLPRMNKKRKLCSGCYLDNKFHVIGGRGEKNNQLTCGEAYDKVKNTWEMIPNMLEDDRTDTPPARVTSHQSPPLVAVANNELYCLETCSNEVRVYIKSSKAWKNLGRVPVRADIHEGWGVAFKSLGNELFVIGRDGNDNDNGTSMTIYTCSPMAESDELKWRRVECYKDSLNFFLLNCSVMLA